MSTNSPANFGGFNARWLKYEEVARTFVPVPQFNTLTQSNHSLLLGPRGCGKTTLLKMLTYPALSQWNQSERANRFEASFSPPQFEAIYIPADVRWCYELASISDYPEVSHQFAIKSQRLMVCSNILLSVLQTADRLVAESRDAEWTAATRIISYWKLPGTMATFKDIRATVRSVSSSVRAFLAAADSKGLELYFQSLSPLFFGHPIDCASNTIDLIVESLESSSAPKSWALCFDELEIAPEWLRKELLEALRSTSQTIFLKLTWTPLLPSGLRTMPASGDDFKTIRLWHSHLADPKAFCEDVTRDFLRDRFQGQSVSPIDFFSRSILAAEEHEEPEASYQAGSTEHSIFMALASIDPSFRKALTDRNIDPLNPAPKSNEEKDEFFRKVKPVVLLRNEFLKAEAKGRSRKAVTVYAGREAIYGMSEGNPRWLLGLLNDLVDAGSLMKRKAKKTEAKIGYAIQARVLNAVARRFTAQIKASPFSTKQPTVPNGLETLWDFIERIGSYFRETLLGKEFHVDPVGSFVVPEGADAYIIELVEQLLEIGALIYVGSSSQDVPVKIPGSRFKLSNLLAPAFRLPLRLYRELPLNEVLSGVATTRQLELDLPA